MPPHGIQHAGLFLDRYEPFPADLDDSLKLTGPSAEMFRPHGREYAVQLHELFYLCKRETQLLISSNEYYSLKVALLIATVSGGSPRWFRQKAFSLIKPNCL